MFSRMLNRFRQCINNIPSSFYSVEQCCIGNPYFYRPIFQTLSTSFMRKPDISSSIPRLFSRSSPTTIGRTVMAIIINTFKGCPWRAPTHVTQELRKIIFPFRCYSNTSSPIPRIGYGLRIQTSLFHISPCTVFRRILSILCFSMRSMILTNHLSCLASTALRISSTQSLTPQDAFCSTDTLTQPIDPTFWYACPRQDHPKSKSASDQIVDDFLCAATATQRLSMTQHRGLNDTLCPATATTQHIRITIARRIRRENSPIAKCLSGKIWSGLWHEIPPI